MSQGVKYSAGECIWDDAFGSQPWCAIKEGLVNTGFMAGAGGENWDVCNCRKKQYIIICLLFCYNSEFFRTLDST